MKNINRKRVLLATILLILVFQVGVLFCAKSGVSLRNNQVGYSNEYLVSPSRPDFRAYRFEKHYGSHDWVADSALRLINMSDNEQYRKLVQWLFDEDLQLNQFDSLPRMGVSGAYRRSPWLFSKDRSGGIWDKNNNEERALWMKARRYANFLHGTLYPDHSMTKVSVEYTKGEIEAEEITFDINSKWGLVGGHHVYYKWQKNGQRWEASSRWYDSSTGNYQDNNIGARRAQAAANDAIKLVGKKGSGQERKYYEASARSLGGMTHYLADLAHFAHTNNDYQWNRNDQRFNNVDPGASLDDYVQRDLSTKFKTSSKFPNGGPDWDVLNPSTLVVQNPTTQQYGDLITWNGNDGMTDKLTHLMSPQIAALELAWITFMGRDPKNLDSTNPLPQGYMGGDQNPQNDKFEGSNSAHYLPTTGGVSGPKKDADFFYSGRWAQSNPDRRYDSYTQAVQAARSRIQITLKWAVYYTACALLWTLSNMDIPDDTTDLSRVGNGGGGEVGTEPLSHEKIMEYWNDKHYYNRYGHKWYHVDSVIAGAMVSLVIILPVAALAIVPGSVRTINSFLKKKEDSKFPDSDEINQGIFNGISTPSITGT